MSGKKYIPANQFTSYGNPQTPPLAPSAASNSQPIYNVLYPPAPNESQYATTYSVRELRVEPVQVFDPNVATPPCGPDFYNPTSGYTNDLSDAPTPADSQYPYQPPQPESYNYANPSQLPPHATLGAGVIQPAPSQTHARGYKKSKVYPLDTGYNSQPTATNYQNQQHPSLPPQPQAPEGGSRVYHGNTEYEIIHPPPSSGHHPRVPVPEQQPYHPQAPQHEQVRRRPTNQWTDPELLYAESETPPNYQSKQPSHPPQPQAPEGGYRVYYHDNTEFETIHPPPSSGHHPRVPVQRPDYSQAQAPQPGYDSPPEAEPFRPTHPSSQYRTPFPEEHHHDPRRQQTPSTRNHQDHAPTVAPNAPKRPTGRSRLPDVIYEHLHGTTLLGAPSVPHGESDPEGDYYCENCKVNH